MINMSIAVKIVPSLPELAVFMQKTQAKNADIKEK